MSSVTAVSMPALLVQRSGTTATEVAYRWFGHGIWNEVTWEGLRDKAAAIGAGLQHLGVQVGEVVAITTTEGEDWFTAELGALGIGAVVLGIDPEAGESTLRNALRIAGAVVVIAGDQEQYDKIQEDRASVPSVRHIVVCASRGMRYLNHLNEPDEHGVIGLAQLVAAPGNPAQWEDQARSLNVDALAQSVVMGDRVEHRTHREVFTGCEVMMTALVVTARDTLAPQASLADPMEHALTMGGALTRGATLHFGPAGPTSVGVRHVQPHIVLATPAWVDSLAADLGRQRIASRGIKRLALDRGLSPREPSAQLLAGRSMSHTLVAGVVAAFAGAAWLLSSVKVNDVLRMAVLGAIMVAVGVALAVSGKGVAGPLRRRYGLSRCRAVVTRDALGASGQLLGALHVPVVVLSGSRAILAKASEVRV